MIKIIERVEDGIAVCAIEGKLSGIEGKGRIQKKVHDLIDKKVVNIALDLKKVSWIDSTGLGDLIASLSSTKKYDGNLVLTNIQDPVQSLLKMTNLNQIFDIYDSVEDAVKALQE